MSEWPDLHPPSEMIERQPGLRRFMAGGPGNPLGARALYLSKSIAGFHRTNQPLRIGTFVCKGCIRLLNEDIEDLFRSVKRRHGSAGQQTMRQYRRAAGPSRNDPSFRITVDRMRSQPDGYDAKFHVNIIALFAIRHLEPLASRSRGSDDLQ
jgi:hypothetical protein